VDFFLFNLFGLFKGNIFDSINHILDIFERLVNYFSIKAYNDQITNLKKSNDNLLFENNCLKKQKFQANSDIESLYVSLKFLNILIAVLFCLVIS
jgi:hypothetical protein